MTNKVESKINSGERFTIQDIATDLNSGEYSPLYFASSSQISSLISGGAIDEDFAHKYEVYQEEMRCLQHEG